MTSPDPLATAVRAHAAQVLTTTDLAALRAARVQWEAPRVAPDLVDVPNRSGDYADPVPTIVAHPSRLRVRAAYLGAVAAFDGATAILAAAEAELRTALEPYGEADDDFPERPIDAAGNTPTGE